MAALLRSARLLKFSPSGLLQITGTKRNGPPLGRLYSGVLGSRTTGVYSRQISPASGNAASRLWPYAAGCVRRYAMATEQKDEAGGVLRSTQAQQFDWALAKLDSSVRRTGRITKTLLLHIFHDMCREGYPSGNQALLLLRSCGSLLAEVPQAERTELAHHVWEKLQQLGAQYDVSHYNALLKVYLQNEFKFSPTDFLAKIEAANVQPNRVTYQRLIAAYCQNGDIEGASTILGFMKSKDLPITEAVFNSLVTGHARTGDIESAKNILSVMKGAGIEPGPDTYLALLNTYAEKGDMDSLKKTMEAAESADCSLMDRDIMQIIFTLAKAGHQQHIPEMIERLKQERGYVPNAMNLCLSLITQKHEDTAFHILKTIPTLQSESPDNGSANLGNFFFRHCVSMDTSLEKIGSFCKELQESNLHTSALSFTLFCALEAKKTGMSLELMKMMKEQGLPIRPHFFWPLFTQHLKDRNTAGVLEVVKGMQELEVSPNVETLRYYIFPVFPSKEAAREALKDIGISLKSEGLMISEIQAMAASNLAETYNILSDPSYPTLDLSVFRSNLILGFRKSSDVESMVKITELLFKDERFSQRSTKASEVASYFMYNVINSMSEEEVQAQEGKLRNYFNQLKAQNISISGNIYRGIRNLLDNYDVPELIKDVAALMNPNEQVSNGSVSSFPRVTGSEGKAMEFEKKLAELKAENQPLEVALKNAIRAFCAEENLQRALELKQQHEEEMTVSSYATLITLCCRQDNAEEALNLKREMSRKDPSVVMDTSKYITLVKTLAMNDKMEEAVDMLKEMKEKDAPMSDTNATMLFHMLRNVANKCGAPAVRRLQDTIFTLGLTKPTANLCSPLVGFYVDSKDLTGAVEAVLECQKLYQHMPRIHDIIVGLVEKGDMELLQKVMDFMSQEKGEMNMLYELFFGFLQTGRYREARKLFETPGLRARPGRLNWYAEKCIYSNQMESLEQMVDITAKLFECDRDEMYRYLLRLYQKNNNWQKAEATWTKMQEENVIPREATLRILADILKSNNQEVPFEVPETWYQQDATTQQVKKETSIPAIESVSSFQTRLLALCKRRKAIEAYEKLKEADEKGVAVGPACYDHVIRTLMSQGSIEEAMAVKDIALSRIPHFQLSNVASSLHIVTLSKKGQAQDALEKLKSMLKAEKVPSQLAISKLVQALSSCGNVAGIQEVESLMKDLGATHDLFSIMVVNNTAFAHIKNGDVDTAVELLEALFTCPDSKHPSVSSVFRKILEEDNDKALDKMSAMAERLANHFACYGPSVDLFFQLLDMDKVEDAKFLLARCNAVAEQKGRLMSYLTQKAQRPGQSGKIKALVSLIPDFIEKEVLYQYLMKCHALDKDLLSAKDLYEQMQKEGVIVGELSLKRLAVLYRDAGETAPFPEPPESFRYYTDKLKENAAKAQTAAET